MFEVGLYVVSNIIIFLICSWGILSNKIHDGVLIKIGLIVVAFSAFDNIIGSHIGLPNASSVAMSVGLAMMCAGAFFRIEIYPRYSGRMHMLCSGCDPARYSRRSTDKPIIELANKTQNGKQGC